MRIVLIIFLYCFSSALSAWGSTADDVKLDSLKELLKSADHDTTIIDIRLNLGTIYTDLDRTAAYVHLEDAIRISILAGDKGRLAKSYEGMGMYYNRGGLYTEALDYFIRSAELFEELKYFKDRSRVLSLEGIIYGSMGAHFQALTAFNEVLTYQTEINDSLGIANVYNNFGNVYLDLEKFELAKDYYTRAISIYQSLKNAKLVARTYNNLGLIELALSEFDQAKIYFNSAALLFEELANVSEIGHTFIHLGITHLNLKNLDSAVYYFNRSELIIQDQNDRYSTLHLRLSRAELAYQMGDFTEAIRKAQEGFDMAVKMKILSPQSQALDLLYRANAALGKFEDALGFYDQSVHLKDSIQRSGDQFEYSLIQQKKELELGEDRVEQLTRMEDESSFWKESWFMILVFFLLLGLLVVMLEFRRKSALVQDRDNSQDVDYMRSTRILYLLAATMFVFLPLIIPETSAQLKDAFVNRLLISGLILFVYLLTFWSSLVRVHIERITQVFYIILVINTLYLIYINHIALELFLELVILLFAVNVVFKRLRDLMTFALFIMSVSVVIYIVEQTPLFNPDLFIISLFAVIFVAVVAALSRLDLDQHLEFSNEVVKNADALVFIVNRNGENVYTSHSIKTILGFSPQELKEYDWIERLGVERNEAIRIKNELILISIGTIEPSFNTYQRFVAKDGRDVWMSFKEKRLSNNRVLLIGLDVTENKRIQDELTISEGNFRQINETLSDVFYLFNYESKKYEYISPNSAEIIGPTPDFFYDKGDYLGTYVLEEDHEKVQHAFHLISMGESFEVEYRIRFGKEIRWIREKGQPIINEYGIVTKNAGLCQDITVRKNAEEEIQKLSLIASNTDNFILMVDKENRVEWANKSFYKITGLSEEESIGKLPLALISGPLTSEKTIEEITKAIFEDKRQMQCELTNYKTDGSLFYTNIEVTPLIDENGDLEKYFVIGSDISQRVSDQAQIEKLSLVASNTSNYIIIAHVEKGIEWVNQAFIDKFGYTQEEAEGKLPSQLLHDKNDNSKSVERINATVFEKRKKFTGEIIHLTKEGNPIFSNVDISPIFGEDGKIEKYFMVGVDISERKKYEEKIELANRDLSIKERLLNESEQNFRELIRSIREVFYLRDSLTGKFIFIGDSYETVFGQPVKALEEDPASWLANIHPEDLERVRNALMSRKSSANFNEDFRYILPSGEQRWLNSRLFQILNEKGEEIKISGFTEDITEKKQQELQIKKIADQLDIIHSIEKTILHAESTEDIIYNTLNKTLDKLPIIRASLTLFNTEDNTFYAYARMRGGIEETTDGKEFPLKDFSLYQTLLKTKSNYLQNLKEKKVLSKTDLLLIEQGAELLLMSPLLHGDKLIGSLNVCFTEDYEDHDEHYIQVTNEVANGLAIAIQQSQLKDKLKLSNQALNSSIEYAQMIQQAYIPDNLRMGNVFEDHYILNRPKDIVSGDFYWTGEFGDTKIIAVGDCTGHGVPGAFMTIIGISELNNLVNQRGIVDPALILEALSLAIRSALNSSAAIQLKDGMDLALFAYNTKTGQVFFEGARRPLYQMTKKGLQIIQPTKISIGDSGDNFGLEFETKSVSHEKGDVFYLFSDGITDQFGGERSRKYSRARLETTLLLNKDNSVSEQGEKLSKELKDWQGESYQTDDMVFVAFKI